MPVRQYGSLRYIGVYFHTAPIMVISFGYYLNRFIRKHGKSDFVCLFITLFSLLLSGTRNTVFSTILMTIVYYLIFSRNFNNRQLIMLAIFSVLIFFLPELIRIVYSRPASDNTRTLFVTEYYRIFKNPATLLFGQGFGSSFLSAERGIISVTELTYFETLRRFGLVFGLLQFFLMFYPLAFWKTMPFDKKWIILAYAYYLFMIFFNPFYFSSNGMIILSFVLIAKYNFQELDG